MKRIQLVEDTYDVMWLGKNVPNLPSHMTSFENLSDGPKIIKW